ncbi:MAG: hypothetical protein A3K10_11805 [Bacteroidetes bacterium RIFCSPLOWO2_12_FULL_31_6]|nr:MAG: hypothetical protein A3K10_11805 [Bacteroidetes bacterium RIFCSPLOWO2_12_FULL_31_6]
MKKQIKLIATLLLALPIALFTSCGGDDPIEEPIEVVEDITNDTLKNESYYQIPSPDEMFGFIKECGLKFNGELLNPIKNVDKYSDPKKQALNFGIYSADLAYTAAFEEFNETTKYFGTIQKLAEPIGISSAFDKALIERIQKSLDNPDSLVAITNTSYFSAIDYLEQNEQGDKLGIIAAAGWLETVYVIANSTDYNKNKAAVERLADQKLTLDNLLAYLEKYNSKEDVKEILVWFNELEAVFAKLPEKEDKGSGISFKKKDNGKMVLGGGSKISISKEQFNAIKDKVNEIRNNIVKIEA